jgi:hypothetical protein
MPTPPWHGHLLRGVTEVSHKLRNRNANGGDFFSSSYGPTFRIACGVPNGAEKIGQSIQGFMTQGLWNTPLALLNLLSIRKNLPA